MRRGNGCLPPAAIAGAFAVLLQVPHDAWSDAGVPDPKAAPATPRAALGPFPSMHAACVELRAIENHCGSEEPFADEAGSTAQELDRVCKFDCVARTFKRMRKEVPPPLAELVIFASDSWNPNAEERNHASESDNHDVSLNVAVRIGARWFVAASLNPRPSWGMGALRLLEAAVRPAGKRAIVLIRFRSNQAPSGREGDTKDSLVLVGVGPSGLPSALGPIVVRDEVGFYPYGEAAETDAEETITTRAWRLEADSLVVDDRTIEEERGRSKRRRRRAPPHRVSYPLAFP